MRTTPPDGSLYVFPSDLLDQSPEAVVADAMRLGFTSLTLAMAYHQARDVVPRRLAGRLRYRKDGVFFTPTEARWTGSRLRPPVQSEAERDAVRSLLALEHRPQIEAWTVFLHNTFLGAEHPDLVTRTCFGDAVLSNLCPAAPDVRTYAVALASEVAALGLDVSAEALSAQTFAHGHHHERTFAPISAGDEAILGLCFCTACASAADALGVDVDRLAAACRRRVDEAFDGASGIPATPEAIADAVGDDVVPFMRARTSAVTNLTRHVADAVHARGRRLSFIDLTGAVLGYNDGLPSGAPAASQAWRLSINPAALAEIVDSYAILGYAREPERLGMDVRSVRIQVGERQLRVILRPGHPDTTSDEHHRRKVDAALSSGADRIDTYVYGMLPTQVLERAAYRGT